MSIPQRHAAAASLKRLHAFECAMHDIEIPQRHAAAASLKLRNASSGEPPDTNSAAARRCGLIEAPDGRQSERGNSYHSAAARRCGLIEAAAAASASSALSLFRSGTPLRPH